MHDTCHSHQPDKSIDKYEWQVHIKYKKRLKSCYMSNQGYRGNESFTISLTDLQYFSMRSDVCHRISQKTSQAARLYRLVQKSINQALVAISKIIVMLAAPCISYELRNVYTIRRARWYVAGKEWKIYNVEVKIITFVIKLGSKFTPTFYHECEIKVVCQMI